MQDAGYEGPEMYYRDHPAEGETEAETTEAESELTTAPDVRTEALRANGPPWGAE